MLNSTITWALAALSYDEAKIITHILELFNFRCKFQYDKNGKHFYGIALDDDNGRIYIVNRGTDGFNKIGNFESWMVNANMSTSGDGVHDGFQKAGDKVIDEFKNYIYNYDECFICGHSQGSGVTPYEACLVAENFKNIKKIHCDLFAAPPTGNQLFKDRFDSHGNITCDRYITKGDPIYTPLFRNNYIDILAGKDVGTPIELPTIIGYDLKLANVVKHSSRIYNAGLMLRYAQNKDLGATMEDINMLGVVGERIVN